MNPRYPLVAERARHCCEYCHAPGIRPIVQSSRCSLTSVLFVILFPIVGLAADDLEIGGYYKNFSTALDSPLPKTPVIGAVSNRLRLNLAYHRGARFLFNLSYDISPRVQDASLFSGSAFPAAIDASAYRLADLDSQIYPAADEPVGSFGIFQNLDRALMTFNTALADISVGRGAIAWGSARVINPTDIVAPFTYGELDTEDRVGVDAIRVRIPVGALGELDTGYVFGKNFDFERSAFFLRSQLNAAETDLSILLLGFRENLLAGVDIARGIGGAGFWLEGAYLFANAFNNETEPADNYLRASVGLDYSFGGKIYGFIEYHFNGAGARQPEDYLANFERLAYTEGSVYLMGRHYLAPGLTFQLTPLLGLGGQTLFNLSDPSLFLSPNLEYNIAQDIYVSVGAFIAVGKRPDASETLRFRSEFGGYPNLYFSSFRIYF
jgi:hypothetical protein